MIEKKQFILSGSGDKTITGDLTFDESKTNIPSIIFVHGFKGFKDWGAHHLTAAYFAAQGYRYIKFNLSHSGVSSNKPDDVTDMDAFAANTFSYELKDIDTVINYVAHT
ncbi:MAG: alpha/beta hydrolase, partial [Pedobacter sp.]|nr:alpha/beta hydrolase [Pedobacter sp.]